MNKKKLYAHPAWESCTLEGAEMSTLALGLQTSFREKLIWLEEAETMVLKMRAAQEKMARPKKTPIRKAKSGRPAR